jgi:hypothetical protein
MKETDKAYIAGLLDGEAYIGIKKSNNRHNGTVNPIYQERVQVRMVDEQAIKFLTEMFGGNYHQDKPSTSNGRPLFCFQASDSKAVGILKTVLPYLRVKRDSANIVLKLQNLKKNPHKVAHKVMMKNRWGKITEFKRWRHSPQHIANCEELYQACKSLNAVGV